jgi:hypothetical protein
MTLSIVAVEGVKEPGQQVFTCMVRTRLDIVSRTLSGEVALDVPARNAENAMNTHK